MMNLYTDVQNRNNTTKRVNVLESPRYTGFLGFCICIESVKLLFQDLILNPGSELNYFPSHKISQDHIEFFFLQRPKSRRF